MNKITDDVELAISITTVQQAVDLVTEIWASVLRCDSIGPDQDFFDLGGNSMLLIAMLDIVHQRCGKDVSMDELADGVSIRRIAELMI
jgi:hypothetical protein